MARIKAAGWAVAVSPGDGKQTSDTWHAFVDAGYAAKAPKAVCGETRENAESVGEMRSFTRIPVPETPCPSCVAILRHKRDTRRMPEIKPWPRWPLARLPR